jgi:hypothetical protein
MCQHSGPAPDLGKSFFATRLVADASADLVIAPGVVGFKFGLVHNRSLTRAYQNAKIISWKANHLKPNRVCEQSTAR